MKRVQDYEVRLDRSLHATMRQLNQLRKMQRESREEDEIEPVKADESVAQPSDQPQLAKMQDEPVLIAPEPLNLLNPHRRIDHAPTPAGLPRARAS